MQIKRAIEDIKNMITSDQVFNRIVSDLGIEYKNGHCKCFIHNSTSSTVMSYDKKAKRFKCFSCKNSYDIFDHYSSFYNLSFMESLKAIVNDFNMNIDININEADRKPKKEPRIHNSYTKEVLSYCNKRKISQNTLDYVGVKENNSSVCFEYRNEFGVHVANKYRRTKKAQDKSKPKMWFEAGTNINTLFNMDKIDMSKPLLITEGEFDSLAAIESGFKNSVSIPSGVSGTNEWITSNWTWLEQFEEVIIWFDNDEAGLKGSRDVSNRLTNNIIKVVKCTEANDINELLATKGKEKVLEYINNASTPIVDGIVTLDNVEDFDIFEAEKLETGIEVIDNDILGMVFGSVNTFSGRNGAGKSTILNQIYVGEALKQGYKAFIFSGELINGNVKEWLVRTLANECHLIDYTAKSGTTYKRVSIEGKKKIVDNVKDKVFLYDSDDYNIESILTRMKQLATRFGVRVFVIDNLMTIESEGADEYKQQGNIVKKLKNFAKRYNSIVHLVAHPRKSQNQEISKDDVAGSANITNLSDYVTTIERNFDENREYDAKISILKNRHTGVNSSTTLKFDMDRKRFYSSSEKKELQTNYLIEEFEEVQGEW